MRSYRTVRSFHGNRRSPKGTERTLCHVTSSCNRVPGRTGGAGADDPQAVAQARENSGAPGKVEAAAPNEGAWLSLRTVTRLGRVSGTWDAGAPGVLRLPSGRLIRGRGLRGPDPGGPDPEFGLYVVGSAMQGVPWEYRWVAWPDFGLPADPAAAREAFIEARERSAAERVEVACVGGLGRTGTTLACIAVLDGVPAREAVGYVRAHYRPDAVETLGQRRFVADFA
jgi:Protein-tyrosine phosphatase